MATKFCLRKSHDQKAATDLEKGDLSRAREDIQDFLEFLEENFPYSKYPFNYFPYYVFAGLLELREGYLDPARANLDELESLLSEPKEWDNDFNRYIVVLLSSEILLAVSSFERAIEVFRQAPSGLLNLTRKAARGF